MLAEITEYLLFLWFSEPCPIASPSTSSSISHFHAASLLEVHPEIQLVKGELKPRVGLSGKEPVESLVGTIAAESDLALAQMC